MKKAAVRLLCILLALLMTACTPAEVPVTTEHGATTVAITAAPGSTQSGTAATDIPGTTAGQTEETVNYDDSHVWIFSNPDDIARWTCRGASMSSEYGALSVVPTTHDPLISIDLSENERFPAEEYRYLVYRYKAKSTLRSGVLFPATTNHPSYNDSGLIMFTVRNNEKWQVLVQDMTKSAFWSDTVLSFRIDPINGGSLDAGAQILIERIGFFKTREDAEEFANAAPADSDYNKSAVFKGYCHSAFIPAGTVSFGYVKDDYLISGMNAPVLADKDGTDPVVYVTSDGVRSPVALSYINSVGYAFYAAGAKGEYTVGYPEFQPVTNSIYDGNMRFLRARGIFRDKAETSPLTREDIALILGAFEMDVPDGNSGYSDADGALYGWIKDNLLASFAKDKYEPSKPAVLSDLCEALYAYAKYADIDIFTDKDRVISGAEAVRFCYSSGIITTDNVNAGINVGEAAGIIVRFIKAALGKPVIEYEARTPGITVGAWYSQTGEITEADVKTVADAGITLLIGIGSFENTSYCKTLLHFADKYNIRVLLYNYRPQSFDKANPDSPIPSCGEYYDFTSFYGSHIYDEPGSDKFDMMASVSAYYEECLPGKLPFFNLLPLYANAAQLKFGAGAADIDYYDADPDLYRKYVESYAEKIKSGFMCVDVYPNRMSEGKKSTYADYAKNMDIFATACRKYDRDFWLYIQTTGLDGTRVPDYNDLRWQAYIGLSFGASTLIHFTYNTYTNNAWTVSMLGTDKKPTEVYYAAQKVGAEMKALAGVYSEYDSLGCFSVNSNSTSRYLKFDNQYEGFTAIKSIDSNGPLLVGCFENGGKYAFSLVNMTDLYKNKTNTVEFAVKDGARVTAYVKGEAKALTAVNGVYTLTLECAEGVFITLG